MEVLVRNSQKVPVRAREIRSRVEGLLRAESCSERVEVSVLLTDDKGIAALNKQYRGVDGPTDVLSFAQMEGDIEDPGGGGPMVLGDIVISVETALRQARERGAGLGDEIDVLLAHGLLHLLGYDHADPEGERRMFARQESLLGLPNGQMRDSNDRR